MAKWSETKCKEVFENANKAGLKAAASVKQKTDIKGTVAIRIEPATIKFAKWMLEKGLAKKVIGGAGVEYRIIGYGSNYDKYNAYATAFIDVVNNAGIKKISARYYPID